MAGDQLNALPRGYETHGYRIEDVLGSGGFGITYRACETSIGRTVAVKEYLPAGVALRGRDSASVLPISSDDRPTFEWGLDRFRTEAQTLVPFRHPNIVKVLRFFEANGTAYMVMDYEEGESLECVLDREGALDEARIRSFLMPLLDGLAEVHALGFLHRDIKPDNIYLRDDGRPVLLDFGAARQALGVRSHSLTAIVTSGYAPYEQYESDGDQGPWTDIYAMGAVLYAGIGGDVPPESTMRLSAYARDRGDPMIPATTLGMGQYSIAFLEAIDGALQIMEHDRPQTVHEWQQWLADGAPAQMREPARTPVPANIGQPSKTVVTLDSYRSAAPPRKSGARRIAALAAISVLLASGVASGGYYAYDSLRESYATYERTIAQERATARAARREAEALGKRRAVETAGRKRAAAIEARQRAEAEKRRLEAEARRAEQEAKRTVETKKQFAAERRRAELARREAEKERRRAGIEARRRAATEATRELEDRQRRQITAARRLAIEALRRKQLAERRKFESELKKERQARERAEAALRKYRAEQRKRELAERIQRAQRRKQTVERRGQTVERRRQTVERRGQTVERRGQTVERRGQTVERRRQTVERRTPPGSNQRRAEISTGKQGREPSARSKPRRYAEAGNPWRTNDGRPQVARVGAARLFGRWCGPRGAIRFTRSHMIARRYDNGEVGRFQLAGYHVGPRSIVVQYLMPDGMYRRAFGRFSGDARRMTELAQKQPGYPWRRVAAPWHRC
ncbi:MAG TPA: protein kinase [Alphaproteobacteria bacterium]|nr:protein kinase [Alphaproteobacteria bacterium]